MTQVYLGYKELTGRSTEDGSEIPTGFCYLSFILECLFSPQLGHYHSASFLDFQSGFVLNRFHEAISNRIWKI